VTDLLEYKKKKEEGLHLHQPSFYATRLAEIVMRLKFQ
jgi:hypothetical protein